MARHAGPKMKALFYVGVMLPMWTSYLVKVYAWRLILAKQGIVSWAVASLGLGGALDALLATPVVGGPSLASSYIGMFIVFVYMWLPFMILPLAAALERVPGSLLQASADLGARPGQTFRNVVLPLALPGLAAGSVFTFSLTLGDYIIPSVVGAPGYFIGMMVYQQQGTAGNMPLAAAFSVVPIVLIAALPVVREAPRSVRCALGVTGIARRSGRSSRPRAGLVFLHAPVWVIVLYAFTTEDRTYQFPPPGLTLHWFEVAFARSDIWAGDAAVAGRGARRDGDRDRARHARRVRARAARSSPARSRSRCCSCCRSRCPASSPASRCSPASARSGSSPASGPSSRATRRSAS